MPAPKIDWSKLGFAYLPTNGHIQYVWKNGRWDDGALVQSPFIPIHIAASALHYGQAAFEGMKAFRQKNGAVTLFRPSDNAARLQLSAQRAVMPEVPTPLFLDACARAIKANLDFIPPYGTGGSLYVRPLLFGSGPQIGVAPASEYTFIVLVTPVGPYYKGGLQPVRAIVIDNFDRAAPLGTGHVKLGANYVTSLAAHVAAVKAGYPVELYLDAKSHTFIEEFATSNFIGITRDGKYLTPDSPSVLPSVTNMTLCQIARDMGMPVERRPIHFEREIDSFAEVAACGTAVVVTPISSIERQGRVHPTGPASGCGPTLEKFFHTVQGIQYGELPDPHGWNLPIA